jgi:hypothetical protein
VLVADLFRHWELVHPGGNGYWFYSGIFGGSAFVSAAAAGVAVYWRRHNCHVHRCWRLQWHVHPVHSHPVCRKHHPAGQGRGEHLRASLHTAEAHLALRAPAVNQLPKKEPPA